LKKQSLRLQSEGKFSILIFFLFISILIFPFLSVKAQYQKSVHPKDSLIQIIITSDLHYGIKRPYFRGDSNVAASVVNAAMVKEMNTLPNMELPTDNGMNTDRKIKSIDYVFVTGDIANRMEAKDKIQSASISWAQFNNDFFKNLSVKNPLRQRAPVLMIPGNHDVSNAIGYYKKMSPLTDKTSMVQIYNLMMHPKVKRTTMTFNFEKDKINYSKNIGGIHFCFIQMWPDSSERIWLDKDLKKINKKAPVVIVAHDAPDVEAKHFSSPNNKGSIRNSDEFYNVLDEHFKDGKSVEDSAVIEQNQFAAFLKKHTNIKAYIHGDIHENKYYLWKGPEENVSLNTVSIGSPMKGKITREDETQLTFDLLTIDTKNKSMTFRECFWNTNPSAPLSSIVWGKSMTIDF